MHLPIIPWEGANPGAFDCQQNKSLPRSHSGFSLSFLKFEHVYILVKFALKQLIVYITQSISIQNTEDMRLLVN